MVTDNKEAPPAPGAEQPVMNVATIKDYLKSDLTIAVNCLVAIQSDPDLLESMAHFMHGRFMNEMHRRALQKDKVSGPFPAE